ncbi:MAG: hypothetical protein H7123_06320, partial [Thermoleophilia bacterium]|nr:hypothetical protein [Thermoleophilia bacterium]
MKLTPDQFAQWPAPVQSYFRERAAAAQKQQTPNIHQSEQSGEAASRQQNDDKLARRNKQGMVALGTGIGVQFLGNFKSYVLDRGRLGVAAVQEMRGGQARWAPLLLGVGGGTAMTAFGLYNLKQVTNDGFSNIFSTDGALAVTEAGAGAGMIAFGAHKGLPG